MRLGAGALQAGQGIKSIFRMGHGETELDTVIAIISGQQPKNELEAMVISQMAVTHALTMRSFGNLNRRSSIRQQDSNALAVARLTKAFASQVDSLPSFVAAESSGSLLSMFTSIPAPRRLSER